jgi:hypothetical protein
MVIKNHIDAEMPVARGKWGNGVEKRKEERKRGKRGRGAWRLESAATITHEISCLMVDFSVCGP